jgi:hypothetical protein
MKEGWHGDEYLVLFDEPEVAAASARYAISQFLPGYEVLGLRGWDDFIVRDAAGQIYSVPTVPLEKQYISPYTLPSRQTIFETDPRFEAKIKWYLKPLAFGGDPEKRENLQWVDGEQHAQLVKWWNNKYRSLKT